MSTYDEEKNNRQYVFDDFILRSDSVLLHHNKKIHIPPKELKVFILLLEAAGNIVTKEHIFEEVWTKNIGSDESLTRCIYALRRILHDGKGKNDKYIETVYGKGFRFKAPVAIVQPLNEPVMSSTTVAILPFKMASVMDDSFLHHELIQGLSKYTFCGLDILPAAVTQDCNDFYAISNLIAQLKPEYYFTGKVAAYPGGYGLFIELVHARDHKLIEHQRIDFDPSMHLSVLITKMVSMLTEKIPHLQLRNEENRHVGSLDTAVACLNGRWNMYQFTPLSLQHALNIFEECISSQPQHALPYCYLAECYILLAQAGLYNPKSAMEAAVKVIDNAIKRDPSNPRALAILALLSGLKGDHCVADVLFKHAHTLMPDSSDIYYFQSLYYFLTGKIKKALEYIKHCIDLDPNRVSAGILMVWMTYYSSTIEDAIDTASNLNSHDAVNHPILQGMMALFMALKGDHDKAKTYLSKIAPEQNLGCLAVNNIYTQYILGDSEGKKDIDLLLQEIDDNITGGCVLPMILIAYGRKEYDKFYSKLNLEKDIWSAIWNQDPRLINLSEIIYDCNNNEETA